MRQPELGPWIEGLPRSLCFRLGYGKSIRNLELRTRISSLIGRQKTLKRRENSRADDMGCRCCIVRSDSSWSLRAGGGFSSLGRTVAVLPSVGGDARRRE